MKIFTLSIKFIFIAGMLLMILSSECGKKKEFIHAKKWSGPKWSSSCVDFARNVQDDIRSNGKITINENKANSFDAKIKLLAVHTEPDFSILQLPNGKAEGKNMSDFAIEILVAIKDNESMTTKLYICYLLDAKSQRHNESEWGFSEFKDTTELRLFTPWHVPANNEEDFNALDCSDSQIGQLMLAKIVDALKAQEDINKILEKIPMVLAFRTFPDYRQIPFKISKDSAIYERIVPKSLEIELLFTIVSKDESGRKNGKLYVYRKNADILSKGELVEIARKCELKLNTPWLYIKTFSSKVR